LVSSAAFAQLAAPPPRWLGADFVVDDATRERLVTDVIRELEQKFVFPERVAQRLPTLVGRWSSDRFVRLHSASDLVDAINTDLAESFHDGHLMLLGRRAEELPAAMFDTREPTAAERTEMDANEARGSYGIIDVKVLDGNIGYIEILHFADFQLAGIKRSIAAAMERVRDTSGLIIDLRWNGGGDGETVAHIMGYLLEKPVLLLREYDRISKTTHEDWTPQTVPGPRFGVRRPVWVLTSRRTFSGGEELAYDVQTLKRGRLIGEATGGGAHHNRMVRVGEHFVLSVPCGTVESPVTHSNWEGGGVKPDVAVSAERALEVALAEARHAHDR
jgi:hypothetical protein